MVAVEANSVGLSYLVHSISISAVRPMDATAERNCVPFLTGPGVIFSARTICGLYCGSLLCPDTRTHRKDITMTETASPALFSSHQACSIG